MNSFKIKNKFLVGLGSWLNELQLSGKESRERTRFVNLLVERLTENEKFRGELIKKYAQKDEEGNPKKRMEEGAGEIWDLLPADMGAYAKDYNEMMDEDFIIDVLEGNKEKVKVVTNIVLNTDYVFGPKEGDSAEEKQAKLRQMNDYDIWCESFESINIE